MSSRLRKSALATVIACAAVAAPTAVVAGPALATPTSHRAATPAAKHAWMRYRSDPFTDAKGAVCSFRLRGVPFDDHEQYRTLSTFADGSPELQEYRGPLRYRYTNQRTGTTVVRNLSGYAFYRYRRSGAVDALFLEHGGTTIPVGNKGFPAGEWVFSGQFTVTDSADGAKHVNLLHARAENMCKTLA